jgi:hypothetical protein
MDTEDLPEGKCGRGVLLTTHSLPVAWVKKERGYTSSPPMHQNWHVTVNFYLYSLKRKVHLNKEYKFSPFLNTTA